MSDLTCRDALLDAFRRLERRHGRRPFRLDEVAQEVLGAGEPYRESAVRTHVSSVMCVGAPSHHAVRYDDLERVGRGLYRRAR